MAFSFGAPANTSSGTFGGGTFGSTSTSFGGFTSAPASNAPNTGGFGSSGGFAGGFGTSGTTNTGFGSFGTTTTPSSTGIFSSAGGFGTNRPATLSLGGTATSTSTPGFGGFGTNTGTGIFPSLSTNPNQMKPFGTTGFSGFNQPAVQTNNFFQPQGQFVQQTQQLQAPLNPIEQLYNAVLHCSVFGDERDAILAKWNMMQASWGVGKAVASSSMPPVPLNPENHLCRFKTIGYSAIPSGKNEDGLVCGVIKKKSSELEPARDQVSSRLHAIMGNKPNMKVNIEEIKVASPDSSEIVFSVQESHPQTGQTRKVPSNEVCAFLTQPAQLQNLVQMGMESVIAKVAFTEEQIKQYLENPPQGIDPRLWKQAQLDNPDKSKFIPVPMIGFKALQQRIQCQNQQINTFVAKLNAINGEMQSIQKRHQNTKAKLRDAKRRQLQLSHKVLHVMVKQEQTRKIGFTIQPEEEKLRIQLENLQAQMSAPTQFKGRLNELLAKVRLQSQGSVLGGGGISMSSDKQAISDPHLLSDIKNVLKEQQQGIQALVSLMKEDMDDLNVISESNAKNKNIFKTL